MKVLVTKYLNIRQGAPSVNSPCIGYYEPGVHLEVVQKIKGDLVDGNDGWYLLEGNTKYIWSGGVQLDTVSSIPENSNLFSHPLFAEKAKDSRLLGWNITYLQINKIWEDTRFGEGIKIAVLDSGLKEDHPDFSTLGKKVWSVLKKNEEVIDEKGHGTHCAGIIAAQGYQMLGAAPAAELLAVKVYRQDNDLTIDHLIEGIEWSVKNRADIISMSVVFSDDDPDLEKLHEVIKKYSDKILFVAAAGNFGTSEDEGEVNQYPASFPECISVGAIDQEGKRYFRSNRSRNLTLVAPGESIRSTYTNPLYKEFSDTSFAAPLVTGVLALLLAYVKQNKLVLSPQAISDIVKHTCDDVDLVGKDYQYGFGIINPVKALNKIKNYSIV